MSFMRFLGLGLSDRVPDARTIWLLREKLTKTGAIGPLFDRFDAALRASGDIAMSGQIVDARLIATPRQRNTQGNVIRKKRRRRSRTAAFPRIGRTTPPPEGSRRALDSEVHHGQTERGWLIASGRSRDSSLWLANPHIDRLRLRRHPQMGGDRRRR
jgi:hypothetical protein